jgi:hypothetical protein
MRRTGAEGVSRHRPGCLARASQPAGALRVPALCPAPRRGSRRSQTDATGRLTRDTHVALLKLPVVVPAKKKRMRRRRRQCVPESRAEPGPWRLCAAPWTPSEAPPAKADQHKGQAVSSLSASLYGCGCCASGWLGGDTTAALQQQSPRQPRGFSAPSRVGTVGRHYLRCGACRPRPCPGTTLLAAAAAAVGT